MTDQQPRTDVGGLIERLRETVKVYDPDSGGFIASESQLRSLAIAAIQAASALESLTWREPFLPVALEDDSGADWHARAMRSLADQLTIGNDFYYPLITVIDRLEAARLSSEGGEPVAWRVKIGGEWVYAPEYNSTWWDHYSEPVYLHPAPAGRDRVIEAADALNRHNVEIAQTTAAQHGDTLYRDYMDDKPRKLDEAFQAYFANPKAAGAAKP